MIGYRVGPRELRHRIREHDPDWLVQAENGEEPAWSRIKDVFVRVQCFKCGYCERPMPWPQRRTVADAAGRTWGGRREYDLEHFRPKRQVTRWPTTASGFQYEFKTGEGMDGGYPWLAHDCLNYLVACKTCNQENKKTHFPVSGQRGTDGDDVRQLNQSERPFIVNPVGTDDVPPEELVSFHGFVAVPRGAQGHERRRGRVIIDLFSLNLRDDLILQRCDAITLMWLSLELQRTGDQQQRNEATHSIDHLTSSSSQHVNCARCFRSLYASDRAAARACYDAAAQFRSEHLLG